MKCDWWIRNYEKYLWNTNLWDCWRKKFKERKEKNREESHFLPMVGGFHNSIRWLDLICFVLMLFGGGPLFWGKFMSMFLLPTFAIFLAFNRSIYSLPHLLWWVKRLDNFLVSSTRVQDQIWLRSDYFLFSPIAP